MPPLITDDQQKRLLMLAREALELGVRGIMPQGEIPHLAAALWEPRGVFVTLRRQGHLRGCIGQVAPVEPLVQAVRSCAVAAALSDPRFPPVTPEELPQLSLEISVLTEPETLPLDQIEVGRHGLLVSQGRQRGLLLPQVAVEWGWDREQFLEETCLKAGLPGDAWRQGAAVKVFTAQIFAEPSHTVISEESGRASLLSNSRRQAP